jgi:hypothetical protein
MRDPAADHRDAENWRYLKSHTPSAGALIKFIGGESFQIDFLWSRVLSAVEERDYLLARMRMLASLPDSPNNAADSKRLVVEAIWRIEETRQAAINAAAPAGPASVQAPQSPKALDGESALGAGQEGK